MAKIETRREFPEKSVAECFKVCLDLVEAAGYKLFKKRDVANLVISNGTVQGNPVDLSTVVPFGNPTSIIVSLASEKLDHTSLTAEVDRILDILIKKLV